MKKLLVAVLFAFAATLANAQVTLTHVHGLAYSPDGKQIMIPSHHGLALYRDGKWSKAAGPQHDYMGFAASGSAFYSSGHPAPGSGLVNPFGLIRSRDGGRTWQKLALEGETDFHLLAVSWETNTIFVWNPAPSSRISEPGLHYSTDEGQTWRKAQAKALSGAPISLAVHPKDVKLMAVGTREGVFESSDSGDHFHPVAPGPGTAVFYDLDGTHLWYARHDGQARLTRARLREGPIMQARLPVLRDDAISHIAQNPVRRTEYAIATFERSVFLSADAGRTWRQIADSGKTINTASISKGKNP